MTRPTILTGIRANNDLTLGNYFGAMLPIIDTAKRRADEYNLNMFIPDLHSFTTPTNHDILHEQIMQNARIFTAAGLPIGSSNVHLYRQSYVPAHSELTWILSCFTGFGEMSRMTQFKDKSGTIGDDRTSIGLFNYPILMAADILLYNAEYIPVGDDQTQHLEFARDIAERMNNRFGELFTVPHPVSKQHEFFGKDQGLRIMDLAAPTKKMSKSDESGKGVIFLFDDAEIAMKKIMAATTDDLAKVRYDKANQPGISNLLELLALLRNTTLSSVVAEFDGTDRYGYFKKVVANEVATFLIEFQRNVDAVDETAVLQKLQRSEADMNSVANETLQRVHRAVGLRGKETA